jgi:hypothetical protein
LNPAVTQEMDALVAALTEQETEDRVQGAEEAATRAQAIADTHRTKMQVMAHHAS